jgi:hypothetical protein
MDVLDHAGLAFPQSLPEFQQLFPDDAACARYLEKARWAGGFLCPRCREVGEPFRIATRPGVLTCRNCRRQTGLTAGTVMERSVSAVPFPLRLIAGDGLQTFATRHCQPLAQRLASYRGPSRRWVIGFAN